MEMHEIRWHGRGGQGAVTGAKLLAKAGFLTGFAGVTSAPSFGAERRGAPITCYTRLSDEPVRVLSQVSEPDVVVVLDDSLVEVGNAAAGLKSGGVMIVNTVRTPEEIGAVGDFRVVVADVTGSAEAAGVIVGSTAMVNTAILGSIAAATGLVTLKSVGEAISEAFPTGPADKNIEAARLAFECTQK